MLRKKGSSLQMHFGISYRLLMCVLAMQETRGIGWTCLSVVLIRAAEAWHDSKHILWARTTLSLWENSCHGGWSQSLPTSRTLKVTKQTFK